MVVDLPVGTWAELDQALFADTWNLTLKRFRSTFAYRGVGVESYPLTNSLSRLADPALRYSTMERNLLKQFQKYAYPKLVDTDHEWHWLSIAQHHGLPTRLMDWTYSPLVALHFATCNLDEVTQDGAVWKINYAQVHSLLEKRHTASLDRLGSQIFTVQALQESIASLDELDGQAASDRDIGLFFEPPALDDRIINQFAYFSVLSNRYLSFDDWFQQPHVKGRVDVTKIVFPATLKWEIRDKLDQSNINERVLMPGLDGLCSWLKRHYKPL